MGVGSQRAWTKEELVGLCERMPKQFCDDTSRLAVCHPNSPPGTCKPVDWNPLEEAPRDEAPREKLAAKSSGLPIPLLLGAAYLLLA
jgi:hypothetical protein